MIAEEVTCARLPIWSDALRGRKPDAHLFGISLAVAMSRDRDVASLPTDLSGDETALVHREVAELAIAW